MSCHLLLAQLIQILKTTPVNCSDDQMQLVATGVATDSRSLQPGEVFVALRGERFDGHKFVSTAIDQGAIAVITDHLLSIKVPQFIVKDTLAAYQNIANWWRRQFSIPVIAVTGSVGKTTTKELIAAVLGTKGAVLKTYANYNNEIGVPKTLLELTPEHDYAVIEMAMRGRGQIAILTQIAEPTIGLITNVGTAHIELLGSEAAIAEAKCELLAEMSSSQTAILNQDNQRLIDTAARVWSGKTVTYGLAGGDLQGTLIDQNILQVDGVELPLPLPGRHNALNYLAALAVAQVLQVSWEPLSQGITVPMPPGRSQRYELANDIVILDETYNAGRESMLAALDLLVQAPGKRHLAILGTMKELGERSSEFHQQVGTYAQQLQLDALFIIADRAEAQAMATGATGLPLIEIYELDVDHVRPSLVQRLKEFVQPGDRLLFKASHAVELDQVVEQLRAELVSGLPDCDSPNH